MNRSLQGKMILSYLAVALLTVLVVSGLIRLMSGRSLRSLVVEEQTTSLKEMAQEYYAANGTWEGFFENYDQTFQGEPPPQGIQPGGPRDRSVRGVAGMVDASYRAILPTFEYPAGQMVPQDRVRQKIAVEVNGETVAWILPDTSFGFQLSAEETLFLQRTTLATGLAALAGVLSAVAMGFFLAGRLLKPIRLLTRAAQGLARGELGQQVPVASRDELGVLTAAFNQMSADLDRADQERKRITADITHDLSTPLQIISGYIEMVESGDAPLTPGRIEIIKTELGHLSRLVGDLTTLTQVEAGALEFQMEPVRPVELLERVYRAFEPMAARQGVKLTLAADEGAPAVLVDEGRMVQVLKNLVENALRHTPRAGAIELGAEAGSQVQLWVKDSGQGIDPEDLPYIFERFYRADKARGGSSGKLGLGLAICKALVKAQGGAITAESAGRGQGTKMTISLAAAAEQAAG